MIFLFYMQSKYSRW